MDEEEWVSSMYKRLMKAKSTGERKNLLRGITEDQNRRLTAFIKKKNKIAVTKKIKVKAEKRHIGSVNIYTRNYRVLVDYTNINYDLSLTNYVGRVLRINKIKDSHRISKAMHLYMNILCGIIFKKFSYEHKDKQNNKTLLIFLKELFPFEFKIYESKYIERWAPNLHSIQSKKSEDANKKGGTTKNVKGSILGDIKEILNGIIKEEKEDVNDIWKIKEERKEGKEGKEAKREMKAKKKGIDDKKGIENKEQKEERKKIIDSVKSFGNDMSTNTSNVKGEIENTSIKRIENKSEVNTRDAGMTSICVSKIKTEPCEECEQHQEGGETVADDINYRNGKILQNNLIYFLHKELENDCASIDEKKKIKEITSVLLDEKRFDYRNQLRSTIAKYLNAKEYKEFCNLREKLFKYKKSAFIRWIQMYTKIRHLDLYIVNFLIFLFIDRLNIIIETYMRLNYMKYIDSFEKFVKHFNEIRSINDILDDLCKCDNNFLYLKNNSNRHKKFDNSDIPNKDITVKAENSVESPYTESNVLKKEENTESKKLCAQFNKKYQRLVGENETIFFLSLQLIYNLDVHYFKVKNKITFEKLIDVNMGAHINESNIYDLISFEKGKDEDPWKKFVHFVTSQNSNMKLQKFDYFTVFLVSRFKFYLEEFKENANIDYIYKTIKEEYEEVENFVTCKTNNPDFEHGYLVPLYVSIKREVQKAQEYIKFYGNLTSFINFIEKYTKPWDGSCIIKNEKINESNTIKEEQDPRYFDLPFFLSPINAKIKKEKKRT